MRRTLASALLLSVIGCGDDDVTTTFDAGPDARAAADADTAPTDAGADMDAGSIDAGPAPDSGADMDAGVDMDAGADMDAGPTPDAATLPDAALPDAATLPDAAMPDAALPDAGPPAGMCFTNADCASTEWCAYPFVDGMPYSCTAPGMCMTRPEICASVFDPVCGCNGMTYSNACVAASNGTRIQSDGSCGSGS